MPAHFLWMVRAELRKILSRGSGMAGLAVAALVAAAAVGALLLASRADTAGINGSSLPEFFRFSGATAMGWALRARNFFVLPLLLLMVTAQLLAEEWSSSTLRALVVRPVPRWSIFAAKLSALAIYSALTLTVTWAGSLALGASLFGLEDPIGPVCLGFLASFGSDLGLIALGLAISVFMRSTVGVVVGTILFLMADLALRTGLKAAGFFGARGAAEITPWLPGNALSAWEGYSAAGGWDPAAFIGLVALIAVGLGVALARFQRMEIP